MSKFNEENIDVLQAFLDRDAVDHTEYSLEDCGKNADMMDRVKGLLVVYLAIRRVEEYRKEEE